MTATTYSLSEINTMPAAEFVAALGDVFEHAPWVAERAAVGRPYGTVAALHEALMQAVHDAPNATQLAFVRGHPELGGKLARAGDMTEASKSEQGGLGLDRLNDEEFTRFERFNRSYRERFGFPFVICVRRHTRASILAEFERRLKNDPTAELATALAEIGEVTRLRLDARVAEPDAR